MHDALWAEIRLRKEGERLPPATATIRLPEARALALTANDLQRLKGRLADLASAYRALGESGARPWRGIEGGELAPPDFEPTHHRLATWRDAVGDLINRVSYLSGVIEPISLENIAEVKRATALLADHAELSQEFDLEPLAREDGRLAVNAAASAAKTASQHADALRQEFDLDPSCLPSVGDVRAVADEASALGCSQLTAFELAAFAENERFKAKSAARVRSALEGLHRLFGIEETDAGTVQVTVRAIERIRLTPREILQARSNPWVEERAFMRLKELQARVEEIRQECEVLAKRFDVNGLPPAEELRAASSRLEGAGRMWWLSRQSRLAAGLHKKIESEPAKAGAKAMAADLLRLATHADARESLTVNEDGRALLAADWRGVDSDLGEALEVSGWAETVATEFSGISSGRTQIRHTLLHGDIDVLDEVVNVTDSLEDLSIGDFVSSDDIAVSDPDELNERANRAEALADRVRQAGLPQELPLKDAAAIAERIERYQENRDASIKHPIRGRASDTEADGETLAALAQLSCAINQTAFSECVWRAAQMADTQLGSDTQAGWLGSIEAAIHREDDAWRAWA